MNYNRMSYLGIIFFFVGFPLILLSWYISYPIHIPDLHESTFTQFYPSIWLGIILCLIGIFLTGYYSKKKYIKAICVSLFPLFFYIDKFFYSYVPTSDSGVVNGMFGIFHNVGINPSIVSYFQYPSYFTLNEITYQIVNVNVYTIATIFFILFGILIGLFLFLFLFNKTKYDSYQIAFLAIPLYFTTLFSYLNYQWVPQTLALVFFFLLLVLINKQKIEYKILSLIIFILLVFTHTIIPVIFLLFFGIYIFKRKKFVNIFIIMIFIYLTVLIYYTTLYFPQIIEAFKDTLYGFGEEYSAVITSQSFKEPTMNFIDQIISVINRIRIPLIFFVISIGFLISLYKKKIQWIVLALGFTGGIYLIVGLFFPVLGLRALQFLVVSLVVGIGFFFIKWPKATVAFVLITIILSIFGTIRGTYDQTQFLVSEEEQGSNFLASTMISQNQPRIAVDQVVWGYFSNIDTYLNNKQSISIRPGGFEFYKIFNLSMKENTYIIYNTNLIKEIKNSGFIKENSTFFSEIRFLNNRIYQSGKTLILTG